MAGDELLDCLLNDVIPSDPVIKIHGIGARRLAPKQYAQVSSSNDASL